MERKVEQPRHSRRNPWSTTKTTMILLGLALIGSAGTLYFDSLFPSDVAWSDEAFLPSTTIQTAIGNVTAAPSAAKAEARDFITSGPRCVDSAGAGDPPERGQADCLDFGECRKGERQAVQGIALSVMVSAPAAGSPRTLYQAPLYWIFKLDTRGWWTDIVGAPPNPCRSASNSPYPVPSAQCSERRFGTSAP